MDDRLYDFLTKLPKKNLINLMLMALDEMQAWNGRTITQAICKVFGTCNDEGKCFMPKLTDAKKKTDEISLI